MEAQPLSTYSTSFAVPKPKNKGPFGTHYNAVSLQQRCNPEYMIQNFKVKPRDFNKALEMATTLHKAIVSFSKAFKQHHHNNAAFNFNFQGVEGVDQVVYAPINENTQPFITTEIHKMMQKAYDNLIANFYFVLKYRSAKMPTGARKAPPKVAGNAANIGVFNEWINTIKFDTDNQKGLTFPQFLSIYSGMTGYQSQLGQGYFLVDTVEVIMRYLYRKRNKTLTESDPNYKTTMARLKAMKTKSEKEILAKQLTAMREQTLPEIGNFIVKAYTRQYPVERVGKGKITWEQSESVNYSILQLLERLNQLKGGASAQAIDSKRLSKTAIFKSIGHALIDHIPEDGRRTAAQNRYRDDENFRKQLHWEYEVIKNLVDTLVAPTVISYTNASQQSPVKFPTSRSPCPPAANSARAANLTTTPLQRLQGLMNKFNNYQIPEFAASPTSSE